MADFVQTSAESIQANDCIEWNVNNEVQLLHALLGHKPVGVAKYFKMACILENFSNAIGRYDISSKVIWDRLDTMYDMQALEETEAIPFPNETQEFSLPEALYGTFLEQKRNGTMPPPPVPSPPPDIKKEETRDTKKDLKDSSSKKDFKELTRKVEDKKLPLIKDIKKETKEDTKKEKRHLREGSEDKRKEQKSKETFTKEQRGTKRGAPKDDEDSSVSSSGSFKRGRERDISDTEEVTSKRSSIGTLAAHPSSGNVKRQTRLSQTKVSDDSGSNKSVSPIPVATPTTKRRRQL